MIQMSLIKGKLHRFFGALMATSGITMKCTRRWGKSEVKQALDLGFMYLFWRLWSMSRKKYKPGPDDEKERVREREGERERVQWIMFKHKLKNNRILNLKQKYFHKVLRNFI